MKKLLFIVLLLMANTIQAQEIIVLENQRGNVNFETKYYYKDVNGVLDKFLGTWRNQNSNELFEITFTKKIKYDQQNYFIDWLTSRYKYIKNGEVIFDTTPRLQPSGSAPNHNIFGSMIYADDLNKIKLLYSEPTDEFDYDGVVHLTYNPNNDTLEWYIEVALDVLGNGELHYPYKVPYSLVLTKVN